MCHKFQGTALQHVRAGRCRFRGENGRGAGRRSRTQPRQLWSRGGSQPRRPEQAACTAHQGNLDLCSRESFLLFYSVAEGTKKKSFDIKKKKKAEAQQIQPQTSQADFLLKTSATVAVRERITGLGAHKSACLRVSCPPSFPTRTRFSCLSAVFPQRFLFNTSGGSGRFGGSRSLFSISQYGHCLPAHARRVA